MSEMVERVARAFAGKFISPEPQHYAMARAALEAIREPSEEMVRAITPQVTTDGRVNYRLMIDATLKDDPGVSTSLLEGE